jgi:hypothetical protein
MPATSLLVAQSDASVFDRISAVFSTGIEYLDMLNRPEKLLELLSAIPVYLAGGLVILGVLCILNGYKWHKWVVVVCSFLVGFGMGFLLSRTMPQPYVVAGAIALMAAVIATPLMRFTVAFFGGLTGAFVGANVWTALGLQQEMVLAGAAIGFVVVGMASFMMFKHVVVLFTSIGGSAIAVIGAFALMLYIPNEQFNSLITSSIRDNQMLIPLLVTVAAVIGLVLQERQAAAPAPAASTAEKKA